MEKAEKVKADLLSQFSDLGESLKVTRTRRVWVEVPADKFRPVFEFAVTKMGFSILCAITGLDEGRDLGFLYHLANEEGVLLNIKMKAPKDIAPIKTVTDLFPAAAIYERELMDLFGARIDGLPEGRHYPLPDDWPKGEYPLRKDWTDGRLKEKQNG